MTLFSFKDKFTTAVALSSSNEECFQDYGASGVFIAQKQLDKQSRSERTFQIVPGLLHFTKLNRAGQTVFERVVPL